MDLNVFSPTELPVVLGALRTVAVANDRFSDGERAFLEAIAHIHDTSLNVDTLAAATPADVARSVPDAHRRKRAVQLAIVLALVLTGCSPVEGPLLHARASGDADAMVVMPDAGLGAPIAQSMSWQYQLTGALDFSLEADLFVIDLFEPDAAQIDALHARGKVVAAYLSAGTLESFRDTLEDLGGGLGVTDPVAGPVVALK